MALYRVLKPLSTGQQLDELVDGSLFKPVTLEILLRKAALAEARPPPLSELPGWQIRAAKLERMGVVTVRDLLEADDDEVRQLFDYKRVSSVAQLKEEAEKWLHVGPDKNRK